ncbi:MAG: hypothetical protein KBG76_04240 [Saprospiraceae bacterium]|nr:hypothetical protein [Saprospiraceae bacterium]
MTKITVLWVTLIFGIQTILAQEVNLKTSVSSSIFTDEQWPGTSTRRQGYSVGFDVIIKDGSSVIMPGLHFQKTSLFPVTVDWKKPFQEYTDFKTIKMPLQLGLYALTNKYAHILLHGGLVAHFLLGMDENDKVIEEDLNEIRGGAIIGVSARILFLTAHASYEYGLTPVFVKNGPSGIINKSKENAFAIGVGVFF